MSLPKSLAEVRQLEERAFRGWPALESRDFAGWRLRFSGGYTKRANSINALGPDARCDAETLAGLETPYLARGQKPTWRLTPIAPPAMADLLTKRGYQMIERSLVQVSPLHDGFAADPEVGIFQRRTQAWIEAFCARSPVRPEHRQTMQRMLATIAAPSAFAFAEAAGRPLAMAIGAV